MNKLNLVDYPFKSNFLQLKDGLNLHYIDEGSGPVMLLLHGNPTWSYFWRKVIAYFRETHRVIAIDHIGMGLSSKPQDYSYTLEQHIQNAASLIKFLDLKDITLGVHDWGGAIGFGVATRQPEIFKRFIVFNTAAFLSQNIPKRIALCRNKLFGEILVRKFNGFALPAVFMASSRGLPMNVKKGFLYPYQNEQDRIAVAKFVQDIPLETDHVSYKTLKEIGDKLYSLTQPMCIIWGGRDFCFDHTFYNEWRSRFPEAEAHWFKDANHYVIEDMPVEVMTVMSHFIKAHS